MTTPVAPFTLGRIPRITFGAGSAAAVPGLVAGHGRRALIVTGGRSLAASGRHGGLVDGLRAADVVVAGELAVAGEPSPEVVDGAVARFRDAGVDVVLAVGGGSVVDTGKAIAGLLRTGTLVTDHLEGVGPGLPYPGPAVPLVAVPTTAGTGSEATRNAVISRTGPGGFKRSFRDERLVAADAVVDPDLLAGSDPGRIAASGIDAVTQLLESFVSLRASPVTDALALDGLAAARDGLLAWHAHPDGPASAGARSRMALASLLSGICLANAGLGAVHGLAAALGGLRPVPHGAACGATLVAATEANIAALEAGGGSPEDSGRAQARELAEPRESAAPGAPGGSALARYAGLGRLLARLPDATPAPEARAALVATLRAWTTTLAIPGLAAFGLTDADLAAVVAGARGSSMRTNPIALTDEQLARILRASL